MWDLPWPGLKPVSPALAGGFLTTVPPGNSLISDFCNLSLISLFFLVNLGKGLEILLIFFEELTFGSMIFAIVFLFSVSFISRPILIISFLLLALVLVYSSFSSFLRCKVRLLIWGLSSFLMYMFVAKNFPIITALLHPISFGMLWFNFHLSRGTF